LDCGDLDIKHHIGKEIAIKRDVKLELITSSSRPSNYVILKSQFDVSLVGIVVGKIDVLGK
jgi:hydrogenase maturation factor